MDYLYNNNKLSMPQQVDENTKEIAILKKTVSTPAILYNANIEISTSAGVISQSNVIETVSTTDNSYILDTVGSLFKVINIVNDNIYILYVSSIRGAQGEQGEQGTPADPLTIYPIGSIYMSFVDVSPAELFGGQWEQIKDKFLLASGDTYANGDTGGEATHTLTINEMPNHNHAVSELQGWAAFNNGTDTTTIFRNTSQALPTTYVGGSMPHNNMPPYLVVNVWKRIY